MLVSRGSERLNGNSRQKAFNAISQPPGFASRRAKPQFGRDDDAGKDRSVILLRQAPRSGATRVRDDIGKNIGIQEIGHSQRLTGSGGTSSMIGNSSSIGSSVASHATRPFGAAGSMIRHGPSLRMIASCPGNSNSRGMRTA